MFEQLRSAVKARFASLVVGNGENMFVLDISRDDLWNTYITGYPEGAERQENNCNACRSFIKNYGGLVWVDPNTYELHNIWQLEGPMADYGPVKALRELVELATIRDAFINDTRKLGVDYNFAAESMTKWTHLFYEMPRSFPTQVRSEVPTLLNDIRTGAKAFERALIELTTDSVETVLELIETNSIYRGAESKGVLQSFLTLKQTYDALPDYSRKQAFAWLTSRRNPGISRIKNTAIGTLLEDISGGMELTPAVHRFVDKMDPNKYQRRTAVVSSGMIKQAEQKVLELGLDTALARRHSTLDDLRIEDVLYVNRDAVKGAQSLFGEIMGEVETKVDPKKFEDLKDVTVDTFLESVLPGASKVEVLFEGRHFSNLVSLTTAVNPDAKYLFKWDNHHSWCYNGALADSSTKALVKAAGGQVEGILRCSLGWGNGDDLDLHLEEPNGFHIYFGSKKSPTGGALDVDMNAGGIDNSTNPVENIIYPYGSNMREGVYKVWVNNYSKRSNDGSGFEVEMEFGGRILKFVHPKPLTNHSSYTVATFSYSKTKGIELISGTPDSTGSLSKEIWGIQTDTFHPVQAVTLSPNYWGDKQIGNKHMFLFIEACKNDGIVRGLFNEFLRQELAPHRTAFELLGAKLQVAQSDGPQLSGLGFSSTQAADFVVRVTGKTVRMLRVKTL
jgi:hypothetical protein